MGETTLECNHSWSILIFHFIQQSINFSLDSSTDSLSSKHAKAQHRYSLQRNFKKHFLAKRKKRLLRKLARLTNFLNPVSSTALSIFLCSFSQNKVFFHLNFKSNLCFSSCSVLWSGPGPGKKPSFPASEVAVLISDKLPKSFFYPKPQSNLRWVIHGKSEI